MPAAAPGTETLAIARDDGSTLAVTLHYDPATRAWADPAVTAEGTGGAVLVMHIFYGGGQDTVWLAVQADVPIAAAVLSALGMVDRDAPTSVTLLAAVPPGPMGLAVMLKDPGP